MRVSISTKVFIGFVVVLISFGFSSLYNLIRTSELRESIVLVREGILPLEKEVIQIEENVRSFYKSLMQRRPRSQTLDKFRDRLPNFQPYLFSALIDLERKILEVVEESAHLDVDRNGLRELGESISRIRTGTDLAARTKGGVDHRYMKEIGEEGEKDFMTNEEVLSLASNEFVEFVEAGEYVRASEGVTELRMIMGETLRRLVELRRKLSKQVLAANDRARSNEATLIRDVAITSALALFISVLVMLLTHQAIRRVRVLIAGVQSISRGDYGTLIPVQGGDEIAQLAQEFNKMEESLQERDRMLAAQSEALVRAERFATIGKMSALITHEIRNPLSSIGLNAELLEEELGTYKGANIAEGVDLLRAIGGEVDRLRDVTEEYLQFARLPKPELESEDITVLIESLVTFMKPELEQKDIRLTSTHEGAILAHIDGNQIRQALLNLIQNASDAIQGAGEVHIHAKAFDETYAMIRIEDSGPGVPEEIRPHIFEAFYSTKASGTGMGLSLVLQIITEHGGTIRCQPGAVLGGARFTLLLPRV